MIAPTRMWLIGMACAIGLSAQIGLPEAAQETVAEPGIAIIQQGAMWQAYTDGGNRAFDAGRYAEAEKLFLAALQESEVFGPQDIL